MRDGVVVSLLLAIAVCLSQVGIVRDGARSVYCSVLACPAAGSKPDGANVTASQKEASQKNTPVSVPQAAKETRSAAQFVRTDPPQAATAKQFTFPAIEALDGARSKAGMMTKIKLAVTNNNGNGSDTFVAQWTWSGSGGTRNGIETVIMNLKSESGTTLQILKIPLDRSQCHYSGNDERHEGQLTISAASVAAIEVSITPVEGRQAPC